MQRLVILVTVALLIHVDAGAEVPELGAQARRHSLPDDIAESLALLIVEENSVFHHLTHAALILGLLHGSFIGLCAQVNWQLVSLTFYECLSRGLECVAAGHG